MSINKLIYTNADFNLIDDMYNPRTVTVIVYVLPTGPCVMYATQMINAESYAFNLKLES